MTIEELQDLANSVLLKQKARDFQDDPLSKDEIYALLDFCRKELCNGDHSNQHRMFYSKVFDILSTEIQTALN